LEYFSGIIYAFNVHTPSKLKELAKQKGVKIKSHNVIYKLVDDIKEEVTGRLPSVQVEESVGKKMHSLIFATVLLNCKLRR